DNLDGGLDAGDSGVDGGLPDGGDTGIDCSRTCSIGTATYCANQLQPGDSCYKCEPEQSSSDWTALPIGTPCHVFKVAPGDLPDAGACGLEGGGRTIEYCTCATNGSPCFAPTECCQGACRDAGNGPFCFGVEGTYCDRGDHCLNGRCCFTDGGPGIYRE